MQAFPSCEVGWNYLETKMCAAAIIPCRATTPRLTSSPTLTRGNNYCPSHRGLSSRPAAVFLQSIIGISPKQRERDSIAYPAPLYYYSRQCTTVNIFCFNSADMCGKLTFFLSTFGTGLTLSMKAKSRFLQLTP